ncbi:MAG TPA: DUF6421 family protein [Chthoniobacterales bacterium]
MRATDYHRRVRVLFDEMHSESWSASAEIAAQMSPHDPAASSYAGAAAFLGERDFAIQRNESEPLYSDILKGTDVLAILHPCDAKWEPVVPGSGLPRFTEREIADTGKWVAEGGALLVISEYEHKKYGSNLNALLNPFGISFQNDTVRDVSNAINGNPSWIPGFAVDKECLGHGVECAHFYRTGSCRIEEGRATAAFVTSSEARPPVAPLIAQAEYGKGRVVAVADSSLFGDRHFEENDHRVLWRNIFYWLAVPAFGRLQVLISESPHVRLSAWQQLKEAVNQLRLLQAADGSVPMSMKEAAAALVPGINESIGQLLSYFPHQTVYLEQVRTDLRSWADAGLEKPNFAASLAAFSPHIDRTNEREHLVVCPLYTPNASKDTRFEALIVRTPWPDWLAELERTMYRNNKFVPGHLVDFTDGYDSECAVLFPETISLKERATNNFAIIFCDREAARLQRYTLRAQQFTQFSVHPQLDCFLKSLAVIRDTTGLWDLIHDKSHSLGELPFDPFMIRQRAPFWMYSLEELRVDLRAFGEAERLACEGFSFAHYVTYAVLFDRIFRFAISGDRVRNYDALGGQLLFSFLHQKDVLLWHDNRLTIRWDLLSDAVRELRDELGALYRRGADCSKMTFWLAAHDLISRYVAPNVASKWRKDAREVSDEEHLKKWIDLVHPDEFPLGNFHLNLLKKMTAAL